MYVPIVGTSNSTYQCSTLKHPYRAFRGRGLRAGARGYNTTLMQP